MAAIAAGVMVAVATGCSGTPAEEVTVDDVTSCAYAREGAMELAERHQNDGTPVLVSLTGVDESSRRSLPDGELGYRCVGDAVYSNNTSGRVEFGVKYLEDGEFVYYEPLAD